MMLQEQWLLHEIMPTVLERLKSQLETSLNILSKQNKSDSLPLSSTKNESLKGYISLNGPYITKAELTVRLANHQDTQSKAMITPTYPYFLEQIQQGTNYMILAAECVMSIKPSLLTKQTMVELLETVRQYTDRAQLAFEYPNETELFPYKVCHPKHFTPPLKEDLVIEFCVQDIYIVCSTYGIKFAGHHYTDSHASSVTYKDKTAWIVDQSRTQTQSPMLTELKGSFRSIREICQTYRHMLLQTNVTLSA
ncbi:Rogdi leucine zipper containing protein-domain-containing protein [Circinella umbellata]|nr:Rogdi leucine zipper containing protein-domain-containing protein [Circinella umbellata]